MIIVVCTAWYSPLKFILYSLYSTHLFCFVCVCILSLPLVLSSVSGLLICLRALKSSLVETCSCVPDQIGIWKSWFLRRWGNWKTLRKISRRKGENQQQTQPTYGVDAKIPTRTTLVGMSHDECSHHCATLPPRIFSWVWMLHYTFTCYDLYALLLNELWFLCMVSISSCFSVTMNVDFHIVSSVFVFWKYTCNHS